ncbi:MAG: hypothetical protein ACOY30_04885 [Bacillota bacterium]
MNKISLFIMCCSQAIHRSISVIFASEKIFEVVGSAVGSADAVSEVQRIQPDSIIYEKKPGENISGIIKSIKQACPYTKVFVLVEDGNSDDLYDILSSEVDGCLSRSMLPRDLVKVVELACLSGIICMPGFLKRYFAGQNPAFLMSIRDNDIEVKQSESNNLLPKK